MLLLSLGFGFCLGLGFCFCFCLCLSKSGSSFVSFIVGRARKGEHVELKFDGMEDEWEGVAVSAFEDKSGVLSGDEGVSEETNGKLSPGGWNGFRHALKFRDDVDARGCMRRSQGDRTCVLGLGFGLVCNCRECWHVSKIRRGRRKRGVWALGSADDL